MRVSQVLIRKMFPNCICESPIMRCRPPQISNFHHKWRVTTFVISLFYGSIVYMAPTFPVPTRNGWQITYEIHLRNEGNVFSEFSADRAHSLVFFACSMGYYGCLVLAVIYMRVTAPTATVSLSTDCPTAQCPTAIVSCHCPTATVIVSLFIVSLPLPLPLPQSLCHFLAVSLPLDTMSLSMLLDHFHCHCQWTL